MSPSLHKLTLFSFLFLLSALISLTSLAQANQILVNYDGPLDNDNAALEFGPLPEVTDSDQLLGLANQQKYIDSLDDQSLLEILKNYYHNKQLDQQAAIEQDVAPISGPVNDPSNFEAVYPQQEASINETTSTTTTARQEASVDQLVGALLAEALQNLNNNGNGKQQKLKPPTYQKDEKYQIIEDDGTRRVNTADYLATRADGGSSPVTTGSEYIDHPLVLAGHQYVQGGAGEGKQLLGPDGTFENVQVIKSDNAVPSYCEPPNPCPIGYTSQDGCLEEFVNSASFSRDYQAKQECSCDNEHSLFNCASPVSTLLGPPRGSVASSQQTAGDQGNNRASQSNYNDEQQQANRVSLDTTTYDMDNGLVIDEQPDNGAYQGPISMGKLKTLARAIKNRFGGLDGLILGAQSLDHKVNLFP